MSDRTLAIAFCIAMCWGVTVAVIAGLLGLGGFISWRDPTGKVIGLIAFGPVALLVAAFVASAPFVELCRLLRASSKEVGGDGE